MDNELFELCKEVYRATKWKDGEKLNWTSGGFPLYTSDYLLEKLPKFVEGEKHSSHLLCLQPNPIGAGYQAMYHLSIARPTSTSQNTIYMQTADTPLKALLKLTLALAKAGELK